MPWPGFLERPEIHALRKVSRQKFPRSRTSPRMRRRQKCRQKWRESDLWIMCRQVGWARERSFCALICGVRFFRHRVESLDQLGNASIVRLEIGGEFVALCCRERDALDQD